MLPIDCTACSYCLPCPQGVNIPHNLRLYNDLFMFNDPEINFILYNQMTSPEQPASNCAECGECEERCPQHIKIIEELKKVHSTLVRSCPEPLMRLQNPSDTFSSTRPMKEGYRASPGTDILRKKYIA